MPNKIIKHEDGSEYSGKNEGGKPKWKKVEYINGKVKN